MYLCVFLINKPKKRMKLKEILAVSGKKGLYRMVSHEKNRIIVESLEDKTKMPIFPSSRPTALENITIFTNDEDMPLEKAFERIFQVTQGAKIQADRIAKDIELKEYMEKVFPEYDKVRVHLSDMKKLFSWYNILHENNLLVFDETENDETEIDETEIDE